MLRIDTTSIVAPLLERYPAAESEVFVALDERAVNYARHKLIADIRLAGYRLFDIVSPQAIVGEGVRLLGNVFVGAGCVLAAVVPASALVVGWSCRSWWRRTAGSEPVARCSLACSWDGEWRSARGSTLGAGSVALADTRVGRHCEWLLPGRLPRSAQLLLYDELMPDGARILNN
ncbi:acetyltransferase [Pseudomonas aeruginosa]